MQESGIGRREAMAALGTLGAGALVMGGFNGQPQEPGPRQPSGLSAAQLGWDDQAGEYRLPALPYQHNALEPHIDEQTMRLHHERHHNAYIDNVNRAMRRLREIREGEADPALTQHWMRQLSFNGSGHFNHALFWQIMAPADQAGGQPEGELEQAISRDFGTHEQFSEQFKQAARTVEGGGWAWLALDSISSRLAIVQMESQQHSTLNGMVPLMGIDVWEHAYYLRYQNRRAEYVEAFMNVINWPRVQELFAVASGRLHWRMPGA